MNAYAFREAPWQRLLQLLGDGSMKDAQRYWSTAWSIRPTVRVIEAVSFQPICRPLQSCAWQLTRSYLRPSSETINNHVLHKFVPPQSKRLKFEHYDLRQRRHNFSLPARTSHLADNNFIQRMLYHRPQRMGPDRVGWTPARRIHTCYTMTFRPTDEFTFSSMQLVSIFYMMLHFVGSLINTQWWWWWWLLSDVFV